MSARAGGTAARAAGASWVRSPAPFERRLLRVTRNEPLGSRYRLLWVADPDGPPPVPGQFAMIAAGQRWGGGADERPYLPRAFSVARRSADGETAFLLEEVGPGSARLIELAPGEPLAVLGPLGHGFTPPPEGRSALLVGGGVGIAPLAILQDMLMQDGSPHRVLLGFRDSAHAAGAELLGDARLASDDGSVGHHGLVTELLERELEGGDGGAAAHAHVVRACGPPAMLEAVRALCGRRGVEAELALEAPMACGFGSCHGCAVPRRGGGYLRVCLDGPVVDAAELERVLP